MNLLPIETAPKDGTYIILFGDSGYKTTPLRCEVCRYDAQYRPLSPWVNHSNDSFEDGGGAPKFWTHIPTEKKESRFTNPTGDRLRKYTEGMCLFGASVEGMDKEDLLAVVGFLVREREEKAGRHLCLS